MPCCCRVSDTLKRKVPKKVAPILGGHNSKRARCQAFSSHWTGVKATRNPRLLPMINKGSSPIADNLCGQASLHRYVWSQCDEGTVTTNGISPSTALALDRHRTASNQAQPTRCDLESNHLAVVSSDHLEVESIHMQQPSPRHVDKRSQKSSLGNTEYAALAPP